MLHLFIASAWALQSPAPPAYVPTISYANRSPGDASAK